MQAARIERLSVTIASRHVLSDSLSGFRVLCGQYVLVFSMAQRQSFEHSVLQRLTDMLVINRR